MLEQLAGQENRPSKGPFSVEAQVTDKPCRSLEA